MRNNLKLFCIGCAAYPLIELLWRGRTHWTMSLLGGACFLTLCRFFRRFRNLKLMTKCVCGSAIITLSELCCGWIVNIKMKRNVWDYSNLRFNIKGQICPLYSFLWGLLCIPVSGISKLLQRKK